MGRRARPPGASTRVLVIVGLAAVAVVASALVGWRFARESTPVTGPILLISIDPLRAGRLWLLRRHRAHDPAPRSAGRRRHRLHPRLRATRPRACRRTRRCSPASCPSTTASATTSASRSPPAPETLALAAGRPRFRDRRGRVVFLLRARAPASTPASRATTTERPAADAASIPPPVERDSAATARAAAEWLDAQDSARFFYALQLNGTAGAAGTGPAARRVRGRRASPPPTPPSARCSTTLRRKGWYDDALVVVTSTYGGAARRADEPRRGFALDAPAMQVPLVVKMPGAAEPRRVDAPLAAHRPGAHGARPGPRAGRVEPARTVVPRPARRRRRRPAADAAATPRRCPARCASAGRELGEPAGDDDAASPASVANTTPAIASDAEREALARLGDVAPTLRPPPATAAVDRPDPADDGPGARRLRTGRRGTTPIASLAAAIAAYRQVVELLPDRRQRLVPARPRRRSARPHRRGAGGLRPRRGAAPGSATARSRPPASKSTPGSIRQGRRRRV